MRYCSTMIEAVIKGCGVQWYGNVPTLLNVCEKVPPCRSKELSNSLPVSEVTVWPVLSSLRQVTVVPTLTVSDDGEKAKLAITIVVVGTGSGGGVVPVLSEDDDVGVLSSPPHPKPISRLAAIMNNPARMFF